MQDHFTPYIIPNHATEELSERGIAQAVLDQVIPARDELVAYQSIVAFEDCGNMLVRAIVDPTEPRRVITVYRTSKIEKY